MAPDKNNKGRDVFAGIDPLIHAPARLMIMSYLYVVEQMDYVFLMNLTGLTWGNLATHLSKLEDAGLIIIDKTYEGKKPKTHLWLSEKGREDFLRYKKNMQMLLAGSIE